VHRRRPVLLRRPTRQESRGQTGYWYGHRRREGRLRKASPGRSADLTAERLQEAAELLADNWSDESGLSGAWRSGERSHSCCADFGERRAAPANEILEGALAADERAASAVKAALAADCAANCR
jgi:hypothetical protein